MNSQGPGKWSDSRLCLHGYNWRYPGRAGSDGDRQGHELNPAHVDSARAPNGTTHTGYELQRWNSGTDFVTIPNIGLATNTTATLHVDLGADIVANGASIGITPGTQY